MPRIWMPSVAVESPWQRREENGRDGRSAYAAFLESPGDQQQKARLRQEAIATVGAFLRGLQGDRRP
jgi:hypothetical protein